MSKRFTKAGSIEKWYDKNNVVWTRDPEGGIYPFVFPKGGLCTKFLDRKYNGDNIRGSLVQIKDLPDDYGFKLNYSLCPFCPQKQKCPSFNNYSLPFHKV